MTECDRTQLVGGYVLGALEPDERDEMALHLSTCRACAKEHASLAGLPALLDHIEPEDVPPPMPPPSLEERVLDRVAKEAGRRVPVRRRATPWLRRRLVVGAAIAAAAAALALALVLPEGEGGDAYAHAELHGLSGAWATAELASKDEGTGVRLHVRGLTPARRAVYELWCVRSDGSWISGGTFHAAGGRADVELTAAVRAGDYHRMVVTVRAGENRKGPPVLDGELRY
jgi:anti-sigma-K factor RskA